MTIPLTGTGGFFTRLGHIGQLIYDTNVFQATTLVTDTNNISAQFTGSDLKDIDGFEGQLLSGQQSTGGYISYWAQNCSTIINNMVLLDNPLLTSTNTLASLQELIRQMQVASQSVQQYLTTDTVTASSGNIGNGVCVASVKTPDGLNCQMALVENITVQCTADENSSISLAGNETFSARGQVAYNTLDWRYPLGSGSSVSLSAIDASSDTSNGTLINNGDFEDVWTAGVPEFWTIVVGTPGTTILQSSNPYTGTYSLEFVGNGSELTSVLQPFNSATGSSSILDYGTSYACNLWIQVNSTPAAGVLQVGVVNGSNTIINDEQGNPCSFTKNLTGVTNSWIPVNGVFNLPQQLPSVIQLQISLSVALSAGHNLFIDRVGFGQMNVLYNGGPSLAVFSGSNNFFAGINPSNTGDYFTLATANSRPNNQKTWLWLLDRIYGLKQNQLTFPTSGSPTISDTLIA